MPSQLTPNVWILTTAPSAATATITLMCLGETTKFIAVKRPIHILYLPTACSATSHNFNLPTHYEGPPLKSEHLFGHGKPEHNKYIICKFLHMTAPRKAPE